MSGKWLGAVIEWLRGSRGNRNPHLSEIYSWFEENRQDLWRGLSRPDSAYSELNLNNNSPEYCEDTKNHFLEKLNLF